MQPQMLVAHHIQAHTRKANESEQQDGTVVIREDFHDALATKLMLEFFYHGEYDVGTAQESAPGDDNNKVTQAVASHLCCHAIAKEYQVQELTTQALKNFSECLGRVSPDDFANLMGNIAALIGEESVHKALRSVAASRQDELAACKAFTKMLACGHITIPASQDPDQTRDLKAAKQLAVHGAKLFRIANHSTIVAKIEKAKLVKAYQGALIKIDELRSQANKDASTLVRDERTHNDAKDELLTLETAAKQAKDERLVAEERASRMAQAMQKMKLDLEVFRNAEHNNKLAVEKANKEATIQRLALEEQLENSKAEVATLRASLEASLEADRRHVASEQRMTAELQRVTKGYEKAAAELIKVKFQRDSAENDCLGAARGTQRVKNEFFVSQKNLAEVKKERDEAIASLEKSKQDHACTSESLTLVTKELTHALQHRDRAMIERDQVTTKQGAAAQTLEKFNQELVNQFNQVVAENVALGKIKEERDQALEEQKRTASNLEKALQESARLRSQRNEVRTENSTLRAQASDVHTATPEGTRMLRVSSQQNGAMAQQAAETASLRSELNQVRLQNFTLQRSIYDLQFIILNNAENRQQLLEYGGGANFSA